MTPKQRILATVNREKTDRLPVDLWYTPEVGRDLRRHVGVDTDEQLYDALGLDKIVWVFPEYRTDDGGATGSQVGAQAIVERTMWGAPLKAIKAGEAHYNEFGEAPLNGYDDPKSLDDYPYWPDVDRFEYEKADQTARQVADRYAVVGPWVSFFEIYCQMRGLEQSMMDLAMNPELVNAVLDRVESIQTQMMKRYYDRSADVVDFAFVSDDIAGQTSLLMSPEMWQRHLQPRMQRWCKLIHGYGLKVFYHTDGAARPLIEPLIECGIDVLNPIQHVCPGMDTASLKQEFGDRVIFHGGVDNQHVLPYGTAKDVAQEVRQLHRTLGGGGQGFICCSCHNVQAGTPAENIVAMIETAKECG